MRAKLIGQSPEYYKLYEILRKLERFTQLAPFIGWSTTSPTTTIPPEQQAATAFIQRVEAAGGVTEAEACLISDIKALMDVGLWDKASAVWLPHGYAESKLYAVKGGSGVDLGFTRAGTRYRTGPSLVETVPYNLLSRGSQFDNAAWTKNNVTVTPDAVNDPLGNSNADQIIETTANGIHSVNHTAVSVISGNTYRCSVYAKDGAGSRFFQVAGFGLQGSNEAPIFDLRNGTVTTPGTSAVFQSASITPISDGWYKCSVVLISAVTGLTSPTLALSNSDSNHGVPSYVGNTGAYIYLWRAQVTVGSDDRDIFPTTDRFNVPALDYTGSTCPALSLEPARTNLALHSEDFSNATWSKNSVTVGSNSVVAPDGLSSADSLTATGADSSVTQVVATGGVAGVYTTSVWLKSTGAISIRLHVNNPANQINCDLTTQWQRFSLTYTANVANVTISIGGGTTFTTGEVVHAWGVQHELGGYASSYIPTTTATVSRIADAVLALLPKGTNQALQSQTLGTTWIPTNCVVVSDDTTAPDSTLTADRLRENSATNTFFTFRQEYTKAAKQILYTYSFHAKKSQRNWLRLALTDGTNSNGAHAWYNLDTGVVGSDALTGTSFSFVNKSIEDKGNGWYRCVLTALSDNTTGLRTYAVIEVADGPTIASHTGTTTDGLYLWGAQLEQGDEATTYVATTTAPKHNGTVIGQTEGTLYFEGRSYNDGTNRNILTLTDNTLSNRIKLFFSSANIVGGLMSLAGVIQGNITTAYASNELVKIVLVYRNNYFAIFVNGIKIGEDLIATVPAVYRVGFDDGVTITTDKFNGDGNIWLISSTALSDAEAIIATTP